MVNNMEKIRKIIIVLLLLVLMFQMGKHLNGDELEYNELSKNYYIENAYKETSSKNLVTAIYLDYRVFDSFFEAGILLVAVTGIAFMAVKDEELL